jgi:hypothetical protein
MYKSYVINRERDIGVALGVINKECGGIICVIDRPHSFVNAHIIYAVPNEG